MVVYLKLLRYIKLHADYFTGICYIYYGGINMSVSQIICLIALLAGLLIIALWQFGKSERSSTNTIIGWVFLALFLILLFAGVLGFYSRG